MHGCYINSFFSEPSPIDELTCVAQNEVITILNTPLIDHTVVMLVVISLTETFLKLIII